MILTIKPEHAGAIREHAARDYPEECCGALLGAVEGCRKVVVEIVPMKNLRHDPSRAPELLPVGDLARETGRNRYLVDPLEQLRMEKGARARGLEVLGYYHSHPDHPARPSNYDRAHAWPCYSYLIVSVERTGAQSLTCWVQDREGGTFRPEELEVLE